MVDENAAAPNTPASKPRSTVRLRKLGHASTPQVPTTRRPGRRQELTSADSPITFPTDSPVHSEQLSRHINPTGRRKKNAFVLRGNSDTGHSIAKSNDGEPPFEMHGFGVEDHRFEDDEHISQDSLPILSTKRPAERGSNMEIAGSESHSQAPGGLDIPCLQPSPSHDGSPAYETLDEPRTKASPTKRKPPGTPQAATSLNAHGVSGRQARKQFEAAKREKAAAFLKELDDTVAGGKLTELTESTGGVKLNWTNRLNTTAGRANWKRETVRSGSAEVKDVQYRHHASIDIAEKVIDNEHRLLNVIAHEFCHLANFMISGVTGNPHGKEFKSWASKCSGAFGQRGIEVTTKHSYDIDFKYIWNCTGCMVEYKRHSKSIDPARHRCGACGEALRQIKPRPRVGATGKASAYQTFMKEQMKVIKAESPSLPQKEIMRMVAEQWAASPLKGKSSKLGVEATTDGTLQDVTDQLNTLELGSGS